MKSNYLTRMISVLSVIVSTLLLSPYAALATDDIAEMRKQLDEQRALIQLQQEQLKQQAQDIEKMSQRLDEMTAGKAASVPSVATTTVPGTVPVTQEASETKGSGGDRDNIGDLNSAAVRAGEFPGSFKIPGTQDISLRIGGFVKAVAIADSDAEVMGADFLPANLGASRNDKDGAFSIDATITRLFLDARAPARNGKLRGYIESDLNKNNDGVIDLKMRHAYGTWKYDNYTLLAGHTWSTFMDLKIIPEGLTEPTVSGVIFMRQPQIRLSHSFQSGLALDAAIEDPNSSDVFDSSANPEKNNTKLPDFVLGVEYGRKGIGHLRLGGILRDIEVGLPGGGDDSDLGWGLALTGHLEFMERDRLRFCGVYGEGLGRYFLGIQSSAGSAIDPVENELELRDNWGAMASYEHHWNDAFRSTAMVGYANSDPLGWQTGETFESSTYASANLMWQVLPYLTLGAEYSFGQRENKDGSDLDNHRVAFGFQFY